MKKDWYIINDINAFVNHSRILVFNAFDNNIDKNGEFSQVEELIVIKPKDQDELDKILSFEESLGIISLIVKKQKHKKTDKTRFVMNEKLFMQILESLNDRMVSNLLNGLVNRGILETGFDNESNDFLFWIKDDDDKNTNEESKAD